MARIIVKQSEIDELLNVCAEAEETGFSRCPGKGYEEGIKAALEWAMGYTDAHPMDEE